MKVHKGDGGLSLVSMLFTLVALGLMAAIAVKAVDGQESDRQGTGALLQQLAEQSQTQADMSSGAQPSGAGPAGPAGPGGMMGAASITACNANVDLVEKALGTMTATGQPLPATVEELVARGGLSEAPVMRGYTLTLENVDGAPTGKVLVNGKPGVEGCALRGS